MDFYVVFSESRVDPSIINIIASEIISITINTGNFKQSTFVSNFFHLRAMKIDLFGLIFKENVFGCLLAALVVKFMFSVHTHLELTIRTITFPYVCSGHNIIGLSNEL